MKTIGPSARRENMPHLQEPIRLFSRSRVALKQRNRELEDEQEGAGAETGKGLRLLRDI